MEVILLNIFYSIFFSQKIYRKHNSMSIMYIWWQTEHFILHWQFIWTALFIIKNNDSVIYVIKKWKRERTQKDEKTKKINSVLLFYSDIIISDIGISINKYVFSASLNIIYKRR